MASIDVLVPDIGSFSDVAVIDVLVKPGDRVQLDTALVTLETEKATMDVPSSAAGVITQVHVDKASKVSAGTRIATVELAAGAAPVPAPAVAAAPAASPAPLVAPAPPAAAAPPAAPAPAPPPRAPGAALSLASPSVRRFARELGVDLARVRGSGLKGRITPEDVKAFVKGELSGGTPAMAPGPGSALPGVAVVDFAKFGPVQLEPLTRIQRISGPRLHASWVNVPHVTQFDQADITQIEEARRWLKPRAQAEGIRLTPLAFVIRACVLALREFPRFNASLDPSGQQLVRKDYCHVGFAADTPNGLMVPVIRDADRLDLFGLARALGALSEKARQGKLSAAEMQGGCFTVSSLGGVGGTAFTPIINAPELAILGVSKSSFQAVWRDGAFVPRLMLPLSLSYDHRVIDGAAGARFTNYLATALADAERLAGPLP